jgi:hypothetical protein
MKKEYQRIIVSDSVPLDCGEAIVQDIHVQFHNIGLVFMNEKNNYYEIQVEVEESYKNEIINWAKGWLTCYKKFIQNFFHHPEKDLDEENLLEEF